MAGFEKPNVFPDITTREQLEIVRAELMGKLGIIQDRINSNFENYSDYGKILKVTIQFCSESLNKTIAAFNQNAGKEELPEIKDLVLQREKLFFYNVSLIINVLNSLSEDDLKDLSGKKNTEINDVINALNSTRLVSDFIHDSVYKNNFINEEKLISLRNSTKSTLEKKLSENKKLKLASKTQSIYEGLDKTLVFCAYLTFIKVSLIALDVGIDILHSDNAVFAKKQLQMMQEKAVSKRNAEIGSLRLKEQIQRARLAKNEKEVMSLHGSLFTGERSREITEKIAELKTTLAPPAGKKS